MATVPSDPQNFSFPTGIPQVLSGEAGSGAFGLHPPRDFPTESWATLAKIWWRHADIVEVCADFILANLAILVSYAIYHQLQVGRLAKFDLSEVEIAGTVIGIFFALTLKANGGYSRATSLLRVRETEKVITASTQLCFIVFGVSFWAELPIPRFIVLFACFLIPLFVISGKHSIYWMTSSLVVNEKMGRRTVIYGGGLSGLRVFSLLARSPRIGLDPVAVVDEDINSAGTKMQECGYSPSRELEVMSGPLTAEMLRGLSADVVIVNTSALSAEAFNRISLECSKAGVTLTFAPYDTVISRRSVSVWDADGLIFTSIEDHKPRSIYTLAKRAFDFTAALILLILLLPLLAAIAAMVRLTSKGPALFTQERIGRNGRIFNIYKFRTMHVSSPKHAYSPTGTRDRRVTTFGRFLRRTSIDELPQLINVLKGDMSLVGPRPEMPFIVDQYNDIHRQRLKVLPGITGLWQISAGRAQLIHENIQYDLYYIRNQSFFMDLAILLHTAVFAMRGV